MNALPKDYTIDYSTKPIKNQKDTTPESPVTKRMMDVLVKGILQAAKDDGVLPEGTRI